MPRALRDQQPGQLPDEERVTATAFPQLGGDLRRQPRPGQLPGHRLDLGRPEAVQGELLRRTGELAQLRGCLSVPVGTEQQHSLRGEGARQESQQPQRRPVSPLQVVEHHQHGPVSGQAAQAPGYRFEQAELRVGRGGRAHRFSRPGGGLQQPARLAEIGHRQTAGPQDL